MRPEAAVRPRGGAAGVRTGTGPRVLASVLTPSVALAIWERTLSPRLVRLLTDIAPDRLPSFEAEAVSVERIADRMDAAAAAAGASAHLDAPVLREDVVLLARTFAELMSIDALSIRLEPVRDDACRKFHLDRCTLRLIATYLGPGTDYAIADGTDPPDDVRRVPTGAAAVFKGSLSPGPAPRVLHRSPPIEGSGIARLVLVLDDPRT